MCELHIQQIINLHHSTRSSSGDFLRPNLFRNSYFHGFVCLLNNLPSDIKLSSSVATFKTKLYLRYTITLS
jgi:hypothetical protein